MAFYDRERGLPLALAGPLGSARFLIFGFGHRRFRQSPKRLR
jgi:hypothetical protein